MISSIDVILLDFCKAFDLTHFDYKIRATQSQCETH